MTELPAQNLDAERAVLGCLLHDNAAADEVGNLTAEHFYGPAHAIMFATFKKLREKKRTAVDPVTLCDALGRAKQLQEVGGAPYVADIFDTAPSSLKTKHYAKIIVDRFRLRQIEYAAVEGMRAVRQSDAEPAEIASRMEQQLHSVIEAEVSGSAETVDGVMTNVLNFLKSPRKRGMSLGFSDMDKLTGGLKPGSLTILAARPSIGKTALAGNVAINIAAAGTPVLFFSLEQPKEEIAERWLAAESNVPINRLQQSLVMDDEIEHGMVMAAAEKISALPFLVDDSGSRKVSEIVSLARVCRRRNQIGLVVIDYLQLIEPEDRRQPREQQVSTISRALKQMARDLQIPVLCLAQLNRGAESRETKRPALADLRESGAIEQDADVVMLLYRPHFYFATLKESDETDGMGGRTKKKVTKPRGWDDPLHAEVIVAKNRGGETGCVDLRFLKEMAAFRNATPTREDPEPDDYDRSYFQ